MKRKKSIKIYYIANARMPTKKAHGIQIAKMCEAFVQSGVDLTLMVPTRDTVGDIQDSYRLSVPIKTIWIPTLNLYTFGRVGFFMSSIWFMIITVIFLWWRRLCGEKFFIYTVDMDTYSHAMSRLVGVSYFSEMHGIKPNTFANRFFFAKVSGVICINTEISGELKQQFSLDDRGILIESNGVDLSLFTKTLTKQDARAELGISFDKSVVLYIGRIYKWKGLEILADAAQRMPSVYIYIVGGTREAYEHVTGKIPPPSVHFVADVPYYLVPIWLSAADVLLVLGTKMNEESYRFTSPMKVFEYMASGRPVVASATPALVGVLPEECVSFYIPDDIDDFIRVVCRTLSTTSVKQLSAASDWVSRHTWSMRAKRIIAFMHKVAML